MNTLDLIKFEVPLWAPEKHSQTILADLLPSFQLKQEGKIFNVNTTDMDKLVCHFFEGTSPFIILLGHGLSGGALSGYNQRLTQIFLKEGHSVCLMNHRNCGKGFGLAKKPYCGGRSEDLARIIYDLKQAYPTKKIILIGFSMSGNASLLLSSYSFPLISIFNQQQFEEKKDFYKLAIPDQIVAINPPFDLKNTALRFRKNVNRLYEINFLNTLTKIVSSLISKNVVDKKYAFNKKPKSIIEFDDQYTAPLLGYKDAYEFYKFCSSARYLANSEIPTVMLTSKDDPLVDYGDFLSSNPSPTIARLIQQGGGHMGYLHKEKTPLGNNRWMDYAIGEIISSLTK